MANMPISTAISGDHWTAMPSTVTPARRPSGVVTYSRSRMAGTAEVA